MLRNYLSLHRLVGTALIGLCLLLVSSTSVFATPGNGQGDQKNPQDTGCNANNPTNCPSPDPICENGNHTGNPHCQEPISTPSPTPTSSPSPTPTATPNPTSIEPQSAGGDRGDETDCCPGPDFNNQSTTIKNPRVAGAISKATATKESKVEALTQFPSAGPTLPILPFAVSVLAAGTALGIKRVRSNN